ncbi:MULTISPECIES: DUF6308 family protein [Micrococcaceae]|jgi:hypothetical protein|uniref:DUF6308 family protein n=1 Tax=Micrococcaceae TaxID=1268 RepID=UPI0006FA2568|nr:MULTISPECIES: DUF6308 family protein [Micrococcaceae]KRE77784.1 hypothetical protein ASG79_00750 [Arthrobacter sp. Soil761]TWD56798.1 hypothetical protein FB478_101956 [Arthrobacter sp. AG367]
MELPAILKEDNVEAAAELLRRYYLEPSTKTGLLSTGSYFDEWANRGDNPKVRDRITDSDAVAVSMLSVKVPAQAIIGLQEELLAGKIRDLLADIPTDVKMSDLTVAEAEATLGEGSPPWLLWQELRRTPKTRWDVGATTASKIMARKRPHLIPIWDKVIGAVVGKDTSEGQWLNWHNLFMEDPDLAGRLGRIHKLSTVQTPISELRIIDAILWRYGKDHGIKGGRAGKLGIAG